LPKGNILVDFNSAVRVRSREIVANHAVTYSGTLSCDTEPGSDVSADVKLTRAADVKLAHL